MANVTGWTGSDTLAGSSGADSVAGFGGNDSISASTGADSIYGGAGNDTVIAGDNDDIVYGDSDLASTWGYRAYNRDFTAANGQAFTIESGTLAGSGLGTSFDVAGQILAARGTTGDPDDFGIIYTATFTATVAGTYVFSTTSDDGSTLRMFDASGTALTWAGQSTGEVGLTYLNNDFHQGATTRQASVTLAAGQSYTIEARFWENLGGNSFAATVTVPGGTSQNLATSPLIGSPTATNAGADNLFGGLGNDTIYGEAGNDSLLGEDGNDSLFGGAGNDTLSGGIGNDSLYGGTEVDSLSGDVGDDLLSGGDGNDLLDGGADNDTIYGDLGDDSLIGAAGNDTLYGGTGNDSLYGGTEADSLFGEAGNDSLSGGTGNDTLDGGIDADILFGDEGNDSIYGGDGNDTLDGGSENDNLFGGLGNDSLLGGTGDDTLSGGAGNDIFYGGAGADVSTGGDDQDIFYGGSNGDTVDGSETGTDYDVLDLTTWGHHNVNIIYDTGNPENGTVEFLDAGGAVIGSMSFTNIEHVVPCFTPGSMILTDQGEVAVENLQVGDMVLTRDNGYSPIRWVGRRDLSLAELIVEPRFLPVQISKGALGAGLPERDMMVSPQHRMLVTGPRAELLFGEHEVLVAATHMVGGKGITRRQLGAVSYIHILFDEHELVRADGSWSETFQPAEQTLKAMERQQREEVLKLFPELANGAAFPAARLTLKAAEAKVLLHP